MFFDEIRTLRTINEAPNDFTIKFFLYIAVNQPQDGIKGFRVNKKQLQTDLKLSRTVFFDSLRWLKDNLVVQELKLALESDFMVNPVIVMNNCNPDERIKEWNRRCNIDSAREIRLRREKRRRELKKQNQQ